MRTWVVTGPIGSGKSTVARLLVDRGAVLIDGDLVGHEVLQRPEIVAEVGRLFGAECVQEGQVDRAALGTVVFGDQAAMDRLNALTHPVIVETIRQRRQELERGGAHELAVLEAAVYFLWPPQEGIDRVISVLADPQLRRDRLREGRGLRPEMIERIIRIQDTLEPFWGRADVQLWNNGDIEELQRAVDGLLEE